MEFTVTSNQILGVCGFITAIWGVYKIIKELKKPNDDLKREVERHKELLESDNNRLKEVEQSNRMILQSLLVLINHDITGNGIEQLKQTRDDLNNYLVNK